MIVTWGGTSTRLSNRPPIIPTFERVIVAPRSSSGGIERAAASARMRLRPVRKSALSRSPTLRSTGTKSPPSRSTAMPTSTRVSKRRSPASALYQALSDGSALHAVEIDIELARQGSNRGEHLQPFRATWRLDLARWFAELNLADDCAGIRIGAFAVLN